MEPKSFDVILSVVSETNNEFSATHKMNEEKLEEIRRYSLALDDIIEEIEPDSLSININMEKKTITAVIKTDYALIDECRQLYRDLIGSTVSFGFMPAEDGMISIIFVFPGIWDRI